MLKWGFTLDGTDEHYCEKDENNNGSDVDSDLESRNIGRVEQDEEPRNPEEGYSQCSCAVDKISCLYRKDCPYHRGSGDDKKGWVRHGWSDRWQSLDQE